MKRPFLVGGVFVLDRGGEVDMDRYRSSTVRFESANLRNPAEIVSKLLRMAFEG